MNNDKNKTKGENKQAKIENITPQDTCALNVRIDTKHFLYLSSKKICHSFSLTTESFKQTSNPLSSLHKKYSLILTSTLPIDSVKKASNSILLLSQLERIKSL